MSAEEAAAWILEEFAVADFGGTVDYTQCYDHMAPELVAYTLEMVGFPAEL